ncbi:alpha/beta fold hydrolase [Ramlibacter albus]|uniref:Alpha/beta fold hydrolase n=1 Tax=Ramlibacter albus TaxID=2079448 RepID=A0A923MFB7_9BURK|nr:alpha/beta hydrolase [Ramlibacter albus]MBC5768224.1 alpha/beta fold hydrolase [Ramlibacter albus]
MIHGAEADSSMFEALMGALAMDFSVVAYDQRDSGRTENSDTEYGLVDLADDAADLIRNIAGASGASRANVYGTSFGGQIAQVLAARHPDVVDRLILGSTWRVGRPVAEVNPQAVQELARLRTDAQRNAAAIATWFFTQDYLSAHPEVIEIFRGTTRSAEQQLRRSRVLVNPPSIDFSRVSARTLLMAGTRDRLIPPAATFELAKDIANARQVELAGVPHVGPIEAPDRVAQAVRAFLVKTAE